MSRPTGVPPASVVRLLVGLLAVAYSLGALAVARGPGGPWTYAGLSSLSATLTVAAGLGLVTAGLLASFGSLYGREGGIAVIAGFLWFAPLWIGWEGGPSLVRSLGMLLVGFALPLILHLILGFPSGRLNSAGERFLVVAVYVEATLSMLGRALFRNPYLDPDCWDNCTSNDFLIHDYPRLAHGIQIADLWFAAAAAAALAFFCIRRLAVASGPARRVGWPVLAAGTALAAATVAHSLAVARSPAENPHEAAFHAIYTATCAAVIGIALGLAWPVARAYRQRLALARMVGDLAAAPEPGTVEAALGAALRDPALTIAYWLPASRRYCDGRGSQVGQPTLEPGRTLTPLARHGTPIAIVNHTGTSEQLEQEIGATLLLALDNERLNAEVLAQLDDLRASRARIVETADSERQRLERDLHDGAQQSLLALSYDIRLARADAERDGDTDTAALLTEAVGSAQSVLAELRELAHGIHPAILTQAGLAAALVTLAEESPLPLEIGEMTDERCPDLAEAAAYRTVVEGLSDAARRHATYVAVNAHHTGHELTLEVSDDGAQRSSEMIRLVDRIGALGGRLDVWPRMLRAEIPCV